MNGPLIGLLTGPVGVGKTTIAERVAGLARQRGFVCGGLLAPALNDLCGQKAGIWGMDVCTGERRLLARIGRDLGGPATGPYSFDAAVLAWATGVVQEAIGACDLLIVDEIGKLELWQGAGLAPVLPLLASGRAHRALVLVRDGLLAELRTELGGVRQAVFAVDGVNRGHIAPQIVEQLLLTRGGNLR